MFNDFQFLQVDKFWDPLFSFSFHWILYTSNSCLFWDSFTARRGLDIANLPVKNFTFNSRESEPTPARRPFSPISSTASLRTNADPFDDQNMPQNDPTKQHKPVFKNEASKPVTSTTTATTFTTPSKTVPPAAVDEENRTPKVMPIPIPSTPSTVSAPMQTLMTPVAPQHHYGENNSVEEAYEEIEYSFEERRAGFVLPVTTPLKRAIQVWKKTFRRKGRIEFICEIF